MLMMEHLMLLIDCVQTGLLEGGPLLGCRHLFHTIICQCVNFVIDW